MLRDGAPVARRPTAPGLGPAPAGPGPVRGAAAPGLRRFPRRRDVSTVQVFSFSARAIFTQLYLYCEESDSRVMPCVLGETTCIRCFSDIWIISYIPIICHKMHLK